MAKVDQYVSSSGEYYDFLNVSNPVGSNNAVNHPDDVLIVQVLLYYMDSDRRGIPDHECPEVTGSFDKWTARAIKKYQENVNLRRRGGGYRVVEDGRVSPAQGKFVFGRSAYAWTINCLNGDARIVGADQGLDRDVGYINDILELFPQIYAALKIPG